MTMTDEQAVADVATDLAYWFGADYDVALEAVTQFAGEHPEMGYETIAEAVTENTSYVVAEWLVDENRVAGAEVPA